jgi:hypothetical protein
VSLFTTNTVAQQFERTIIQWTMLQGALRCSDYSSLGKGGCSWVLCAVLEGGCLWEVQQKYMHHILFSTIKLPIPPNTFLETVLADN